jgi:hypothetical protein
VLAVCHSDQYRAPRSGKPGLAAPGQVAGEIADSWALADWEQAIASLRGAESPRGKVLLEVR